MADGRTHGTVTVILATAGGLLCTAFTGNLAECAVASAGCLFGLVCDPDLDQPGITPAEGRLLGGKLWMLGIVWFAIWYPYARLIPHRHMLSHWPIVGTGGRLLYLSFIGLLAFWFLQQILPGAAASLSHALRQVPSNFISWFVFGLVASDTAHWLFDGRP